MTSTQIQSVSNLLLKKLIVVFILGLIPIMAMANTMRVQQYFVFSMFYMIYSQNGAIFIVPLINFATLGGVLLLSLPSMAYIALYKTGIVTRTKLAFLVVLISTFLLCFVLDPLLSEINLGHRQYPFLGLTYKYSTLILFALVIVPTILDWVTRRLDELYASIPEEDFSVLREQERSIFHTKLSVLILLFATFFLPASLMIFTLPILDTIDTTIVVLSYFVSYDYFAGSIMISLTGLDQILLASIIFVFHIVFMMRAIEFIFGKQSRSAMKRAGIMSVVWIPFVVSLLALGIPSGTLIVIPLPLQLILGLYLFRWPILSSKKPQVRSPQEKWSPPIEETVTVPFHYLLLSRIRMRISKRRRYPESLS